MTEHEPRGSAAQSDQAAADTATNAAVGRYRVAVRRILVALDASSASQAALEAAAALAAALHSEIQGLFVEDINLVRLTELPFVREVRYGELAPRRPEAEAVRRQLRARAATLQAELTRAAERYKVRSTFRVVRGSVDAELLTAALEADLLALGRLGHSVARRARLGSTARTALERARPAVLLVRGQGDSERPVAVIYDGTAASQRALEMATPLAEQSGRLRVLLYAPTGAESDRLRAAVAAELEDSDLEVDYQPFHQPDARAAASFVLAQDSGMLVVGSTEARLPAGTLLALLEEASQHVLVVR